MHWSSIRTKQPLRATTNLDGLVMLICLLLSSGSSSWKCKDTEPVSIECGKPFLVFHPLSCQSSTVQGNNFASLRNAVNPLTQCVRVKRVRSLRLLKVIQRSNLRIQPFLLAPPRLPEKKLIISSCFDAEWFIPLNRAAQGVNIVAIRYLRILENCVNY